MQTISTDVYGFSFFGVQHHVIVRSHQKPKSSDFVFFSLLFGVTCFNSSLPDTIYKPHCQHPSAFMIADP